MTGYLQRLAASVVRPRPSLHPFVGSIFSGAGQEMAAPALVQDNASVSTADRNLLPTASTVLKPSDDLNRHRDLAEEDRVEQYTVSALSAEERRTVHESFQPLLPRKAVEVGTSAMRAAAAPGDTADEHSAANGLQRASLDTEIVDPVPMAHVADRPAASGRGEIAPPPTRRLRESPATFSPVSGDAGVRATTGFSPPQSSQRSVDDIQIHIGRIEVTAVPQPAPRPAAAPVRKAMGLNEYLGRGRRGPR